MKINNKKFNSFSLPPGYAKDINVDDHKTPKYQAEKNFGSNKINPPTQLPLNNENKTNSANKNLTYKSQLSSLQNIKKPSPKTETNNNKINCSVIIIAILIFAFLGGSTSAIIYFSKKDTIIKKLIYNKAVTIKLYEEQLNKLQENITILSSQKLLNQEKFAAKINHLINNQKTLNQENEAIYNLIIQAKKDASFIKEINPNKQRITSQAPNLINQLKSTTTASLLNNVPVRRQIAKKKATPIHTIPIHTNNYNVIETQRKLDLKEKFKSFANYSEAPDNAIVAIEDIINSFKVTRIDLLEKLDVWIKDNIIVYEAAIHKLGLNTINDLTDNYNVPQENKGAEGVGGAFVAYNNTYSFPGNLSLFSSKFYAAKTSITKSKALRNLLLNLPLRLPVSRKHKKISSRFGYRTDPFLNKPAYHSGLDFSLPFLAPIYATANGVIKTANKNSPSYGKILTLSHSSNIQTRYAHLHKIAVAAGDKVKAGDIIGYAGSTGRSTGVHLHYEIHYNGRVFNPLKFILLGEQFNL